MHPLRLIGDNQHCWLFVSTHRGFIVQQWDCTQKHICGHPRFYSLKQYNNMKALQDESATSSPRDMYKAKERKRDKGQDCEELSSHRPCNETWLLGTLGPSGHRLHLSGGWESLREVMGENARENPGIIKSAWLIFTQFQVGKLHTGSSDVVDHGTLQELLTPSKTTQLPCTARAVVLVLAQYGPSGEMDTVRAHSNVLVLPLGEERESHNPVVCAREESLE